MRRDWRLESPSVTKSMGVRSIVMSRFNPPNPSFNAPQILNMSYKHHILESTPLDEAVYGSHNTREEDSQRSEGRGEEPWPRQALILQRPCSWREDPGKV